MKLTIVKAIEAITLALNTEEVEVITLDGEEFNVTAFAELFTTDGESVYRIIGLDKIEDKVSFIVIDELLSSPNSGDIFRDKVFTYPIRDSFDEALLDYSALLAEKI